MPPRNKNNRFNLIWKMYFSEKDRVRLKKKLYGKFIIN